MLMLPRPLANRLLSDLQSLANIDLTRSRNPYIANEPQYNPHPFYLGCNSN